MKIKSKDINPITSLDYPDIDVIRVDDTYYMVSTTMHFFPGCEILKSYDLVNWEHATYVYDYIDHTQAQKLEKGLNVYGKGMWAASLRYHKGVFYVCFVCNDTHKTYLFRSKNIEGEWTKSYIEGFYHDCSLLFDDDDRVYIAYGNRDIYITELNEELTAPKENGFHRMVVSDTNNPMLGYEGTHFYKINGFYYLFFIHSLRTHWRRTEAVFMAKSLTDEFVGGDVFDEDCGFRNSGIAQGGIVDTPEGKWFSIMFQDSGAVGRMPILVPVTWENDYPVFGNHGKMPREFIVPDKRTGYEMVPLVQSDDFKHDHKNKNDSFGFKSCWQFNHEPRLQNLNHDEEKGTVTFTSDMICSEFTQTTNIMTQRMKYPLCEAEVSIDASQILDGDYAGLCALHGNYGYVAITAQKREMYLVMRSFENEDSQNQDPYQKGLQEWEKIYIDDTSIRLKIRVDFSDGKDEATFYYLQKGIWRRIGITKKLQFRLDHFCGCRFGLFYQASIKTGGRATFSDFTYKY